MMGTSEVVWVSDTYPNSAETSFRELDDVFLQTQTRIWLGEVLHVRLDEDVGIADLLANGELLFQVSKEVWKMLLNNYGELKHSKIHIYERTSSGRSEGRYTPYPKVDSFLKICQILGLTGIDLFSPSDAVDKRNVRRVCLCIRSLSKKAREKKLKVPDFDIVTYNIAMPTNLVGGIRRNLELSQCISSSSNTRDSRESSGSNIPFGKHSQLSYTGSDETESFVDIDFSSPLSRTSYDATDVSDIIRVNSPGLSSVDDEIIHETNFKSSVQSTNHYEHVDENQDEIFAESLGFCHLSTRETHAIQSSSFTENDRALLSLDDHPYYLGKQKSRSHGIVPLISSSFTESEFECFSPFSMCSNCTDVNDEDQENDTSKSNFKIGLTMAEVSSKIDDVELIDASYHSCRIRENLLDRFDLSWPKSVGQNSMSKFAFEDKKTHAVSLHDTPEVDYGKYSDILNVVESSELLAYSASAEMVPSFDFCHNDFFLRSRNNLEIDGKSLQTGYMIPSSNHYIREGKVATSDGCFNVEEQVVSSVHDSFADSYNESQAILETVVADGPGKAKDREGRAAVKSGNHVLKSVASIITIVGALVLLLHVRKKKDEEKNNGTVVPLQVQKPNQKFFNRRKIKIGKSNSSYPREKLKF